MKYKVTLELYNERRACGQCMTEMITDDYTSAYCRFVTMANNLDGLMRDLEKCESRSFMEGLTIIVELNEVIEDELGDFVHLGFPKFEESLSCKEYRVAKDAEEESQEKRGEF